MGPRGDEIEERGLTVVYSLPYSQLNPKPDVFVPAFDAEKKFVGCFHQNAVGVYYLPKENLEGRMSSNAVNFLLAKYGGENSLEVFIPVKPEANSSMLVFIDKHVQQLKQTGNLS